MKNFIPIWPAEILEWLHEQTANNPDNRMILNIGAVNSYVLLMFNLTEHDSPPSEATECAMAMLTGLESGNNIVRAECDAKAKRILREYKLRIAKGAN